MCIAWLANSRMPTSPIFLPCPALVAARTVISAIASIGMEAKAMARGADQFTFPDKDHCIGTALLSGVILA